MKITASQVRRVAKLARLEITPGEEEKFSQELSSILSYVEKLNEVDTDGIEPTAHITGQTNVVREDRAVGPTDELYLATPQELVDCSPQEKERGQIKVPSVFE